MADIGASDLTYTAQNPVNGAHAGGGRIRRVFKITTAAANYPTGGLPLTAAKLGCPTVIESLKILEDSGADAYRYKWDKSANKLIVLVDDAVSGVPAEHANAAFTSPDELHVEVIGY